MSLATLLGVLGRNRLGAQPRYWGRLARLGLLAGVNSYLAKVERATNGRLIRSSGFAQPPVFILGHWRSGTTHLHNLLSLDPRFCAPTLYQASMPLHFVYSQPRGARLGARLVPATRPMDQVPMAMGTPHEDEFALAALTGRSVYFHALFPRAGDREPHPLDHQALPPAQARDWERAFLAFLQSVAAKNSRARRVVLKSPPHGGRVPALLRLLPGARFIHLVRDPFAVFLSSRHLWRVGLAGSALQTPDPAFIDRLILSLYLELFQVFQRDRVLIPRGALCQVRYEDLDQNPMGCLETIYRQLQLGNEAQISRARPAWREHLGQQAGYRKNRFYLSQADRDLVLRHWRPAFSAYGYAADGGRAAQEARAPEPGQD